MEILKKITVKNCHGKKLAPFDADDEIGTLRPVLTVYGRADKFEEGENTLPSGDISQYIRFKGSFAAYAGPMGFETEYRSGVLIMPDVAAQMLAGLLSPEDVQSVNFGFVLNIKKTETPIGYEYSATPLMEDASDTDPLAMIAKQVTAALPKPKAEKPKAESKAKALAKKKVTKKVSK